MLFRSVIRLLPGGAKIIGRGGTADYIVDTAMVSRAHCRLLATEADQLHVEDLASTNGTFVNEQRVTHAVLTPGDRLRLGRLELDVERSEEEAAEGL